MPEGSLEDLQQESNFPDANPPQELMAGSPPREDDMV